MSELKPCPECGSDNIIIRTMKIKGGQIEVVHFYAECGDCGFSVNPPFHAFFGMNASDEEQAIERWNEVVTE